MRITSYTPGVRLMGERIVVLGFFDGVHLAHRRLLVAAAEEARRTGCELCVFTFPSETEQLKPGAERIYSTETKLSLLRACGVEHTVLADFAQLAHLSAEAFAFDVLCRDLGCRTAVCGYNFKFSHEAAADALRLRELLASVGRTCRIAEPVTFRGQALSATAIRALLREGDVVTAAEALGAPYRLCALAEHGLGLGRRLGTPTVNLSFPAGLCRPKNGVYRCIAAVGERRYHAVTNVGTCPTFGDRPLHAECYLLDFDGDLYDKRITVYFLDFLREERAFSSAEELKMQIELDKNTTIRKNPPPSSVDLSENEE